MALVLLFGRRGSARRQDPPSGPTWTRSPARPRMRSRLRIAGVAVSVACLGGGAFLGLHILAFYLHSHSASKRLLAQQPARQAPASSRIPAAASASVTASGKPSAPSANCPSASTAASASVAQGRLSIPRLSLVAPVVQGDGSAQLAVAVGHVPASAWPGSPGTAVLAAHNVSWFSRIDQLKAGDKIYFDTSCGRYAFAVKAAAVVKEGSPLRNSAHPSLVLETCYPLDALWFTSQRYLVSATFLGRLDAAGTPSPPPPTPAAPGVALPAALRQPQALTAVPLGQLSLVGSYSPQWAQSLAPINAESSLVVLYEAAMAASRNSDTASLAALSAPSAPLSPPAALEGAIVTRYLHGLSPTITVGSGGVASATTFSRILLTGGPAPGAYDVTMTAVVSGGNWKLQSLTVASS